MNKKGCKILFVISVIIIVLGAICSTNIKNELQDESHLDKEIYVDGTNMTAIVDSFGELATGLLSIIIITYSILLVAGIWATYLIIILIAIIIKKIKNRNKGR